MNEQIISPIIPTPKLNVFRSLWNKIPQKIRVIIAKFSENGFYANKKMFWPVTIAFGILVFILILGLLFGNRNRNSNLTDSSPTPVSQDQNKVVMENGNVLTKIEQKLNDLKNQINVFDAKQSHLKPPSVNFNVKF